MEKKFKRVYRSTEVREIHEQKLHQKVVKVLGKILVEVSKITPCELTEDQILFVMSRQFRRIVLKHQIELLTKLFTHEKEDN